MIVEMEEDPITPLILRRATFNTLKAMIYCEEDTITVRVGKEKVVFHTYPNVKTPMVKQVLRAEVIESEN